MERKPKLYLAILLLIFIGVAGLLVWSFVYSNATHFAAGQRPADFLNPPPAPSPSQPPLRVTDPARGSSLSEAVAIVVFGDYLSQSSRALDSELQQVLVEQTTPVKVVWRDFYTATDRPEYVMAAVAARCAGDQGKFWPMHDALMASTLLDNVSLKALAKRLGLNSLLFEQCLSSSKKINEVGQDVFQAGQFNIVQSPTLFIGGQPTVGFMTAQQITAAVWSANRRGQ